jgi:hypothetical protein
MMAGIRVLYHLTASRANGELYSMIRDPKPGPIVEHSVMEEVETGKKAEQGQNGGLRADK